jgi:SAM-dependent methyltransferase
MSDLVLSVPKELRRGHSRWNESASVAEGVELIKLMCRNFGLADFGNSEVLDMGCGSKLVQAILDRRLPLRRYTGVDVFPDLIDFLKQNVTDPRFNFQLLNTRNEMYNPGGKPLTADTKLDVVEHSFDIICLFSVFTHLAPDDYVAMLQMLRRYVKPGGRLIFSLFVNETTAGGMGFMDTYHKNWKGDYSASTSDQVEQHKQFLENAVAAGGPPDYFDVYPAHPLKATMYSRNYALRLVENTGWKVESLNDPEKYIQHYMICRPV